MNTARFLAMVLTALATISSASAQQRVDAVTLELQTAPSGPTISRHIFGQFAEHLGRGIYEGIWVGPDSSIPNTRGIRNDVVKALKELRVPNVRWPGGCFADEYHWQKGIGPREQRPATLNPNWGGVIEPNTFGTHEFMDFARQVGADAYISVNVGSGTAQEAADWLEYMTTDQPTALAKQRSANGDPEPFEIPFLGLGNENWGCGGSMTPEHYVGQMKIFARYSRNYNTKRPMLKIAVGPDGADTSYTEAVMKAWKERNWSWDIDGLSMHFYTVGGWPPKYPATGFGEAEYVALVKETLRMEGLIRTHGAIMDKYDPEKKIALVVDEWGSWLAPTEGSKQGFLEQQNSQRDAIIAALNFNIFARNSERVRMANIAQMVNVLQAMIFTDKEKMLLTPTYHVHRMYVPFQDAKLLAVKLEAGKYVHGETSLPRVDAVAAKDKSGRIWLSITNVDAHRSVQVELPAPGVKRAVGEILSAPKIDSVNTFQSPDVVKPQPLTAKASNSKIALKLPPHSIAVFALEP